MITLFPLIFSLVFLTIFSTLELILIRSLNKAWWRYKFVRWSAYFLPLLGIISIFVWYMASFYRYKFIALVSSVAAAASLVLLLGLTLSLPISGILNQIHHLLEKKSKRKAEEGTAGIDRNRRILLKGTAAALPLITVAMGSDGIAGAFRDARVFSVPMGYQNLPQQLKGLKILQLSDSHLGIYKFLKDYERVITMAQPFKPDLVLLTGDIADDLALLPDTLKLAESLKPRYGTFASLGNHEYYRGIKEVLRIFDRSTVPLLRSSGTAIDINGYPLYLAGADDPLVLRYVDYKFLKTTIDKALQDAPTGAFRVVMCHRPEGFVSSAEAGAELTLSGHIHGGQVGFERRSFFSLFMPDRYLWGKYSRGNSQLYVTSGIGHWFPFRLGCPTEGPVIELSSQS